MAWGEAHVLTGIVIQLAAGGSWELALPVAILSHWPLDDLNIGEVARVYHGTGEGPVKILTSVARTGIIGAIAFVFYRDPSLMICGLPAWLVLDHEWILRLVGRPGYGLHARMWPAWAKTELGLIPWFTVLVLLSIIVIR